MKAWKPALAAIIAAMIAFFAPLPYFISYPGDDGMIHTLTPDTPVSMNMWGFYPSYFDFFEKDFDLFFQASGQELKSEYYIPSLIDSLIRSGERRTQVLECDAEWFGVTYKEDKAFVSARLNALLEEGVYPFHLWMKGGL